MANNVRNVPPKASAMLEALRGLGYSTADALADIVDNSISAGASVVRIDFCWEDGDGAFISILDNGRGMDDPELEAAMRLGEKSPLDKRSRDDLGRFGIGLKTASFSQCRSLTVSSRKEGGASPACAGILTRLQPAKTGPGHFSKARRKVPGQDCQPWKKYHPALWCCGRSSTASLRMATRPTIF
jgi:hypothetical protein